MPRELGFPLGDSGKEGREIIDRVNLIFLDNFQKPLSITDIGLGGRTAFKKLALRLRPFDVTSDDIALRNHPPDLHCELGADLTGRSDNQNIFHCRKRFNC